MKSFYLSTQALFRQKLIKVTFCVKFLSQKLIYLEDIGFQERLFYTQCIRTLFNIKNSGQLDWEYFCRWIFEYFKMSLNSNNAISTPNQFNVA